MEAGGWMLGSLFSAKLLIPSQKNFSFSSYNARDAHMSEQASISEFRIYVDRDYRAQCWRLLLSTDR